MNVKVISQKDSNPTNNELINLEEVIQLPTEPAEREKMLVEALRSVITNHCPNDKFFCGTCSPARKLLAAIEREGN